MARLASDLPARRSHQHHRKTSGTAIPYISYATADWDAIALAYAESEQTVDAICAQYGVSREALYYRARRDGWPYRIPKTEGPAPRRVSAQSLGRRLLSALDRKLSEFEHRLEAAATGTPSSTADSERDARTLGTLVRLFHKLEMPGGPKPGARKRAAKDAPTPTGDHDADRLRHALAQRLETLRVSLAD